MRTATIDLISKKTNYLHVQHTLMYISLRCFLHIQCRFARLKRQTSSLHIIFYGGIVVCAHQKFWCLVSCSLLFFSLPLIFTLLAASISHLSHRRYEIFTFFSFVFNYSLWLLLCYPRECRYKK